MAGSSESKTIHPMAGFFGGHSSTAKRGTISKAAPPQKREQARSRFKDAVTVIAEAVKNSPARSGGDPQAMAGNDPDSDGGGANAKAGRTLTSNG